MVPYIMNQC